MNNVTNNYVTDFSLAYFSNSFVFLKSVATILSLKVVHVVNGVLAHNTFYKA